MNMDLARKHVKYAKQFNKYLLRFSIFLTFQHFLPETTCLIGLSSSFPSFFSVCVDLIHNRKKLVSFFSFTPVTEKVNSG